ncbi:unnamed protein product [Protopolystoma xenopodis]|uniref:Uncharacterized protein n=1 Tax=Protopolystoma xenopodis TaxID=117903 RepID=A0A448XQD4_9PLAT|nr:unnamed protein product [Protopolystoma xenopodis]
MPFLTPNFAQLDFFPAPPRPGMSSFYFSSSSLGRCIRITPFQLDQTPAACRLKSGRCCFLQLCNRSHDTCQLERRTSRCVADPSTCDLASGLSSSLICTHFGRGLGHRFSQTAHPCRVGSPKRVSVCIGCQGAKCLRQTDNSKSVSRRLSLRWNWLDFPPSKSRFQCKLPPTFEMG